MKKQIFNPFLPINEYIPDGEPHVFNDRIYLYGSHDKENGETFCMLPYVIWSAPVNDLSDWSNKGVSYSAEQDPLYSKTRPYMFAPDCVRGNDGRYYLYYCLAGDKGKGGYYGPISVARCDEPDGKFEFYGVVKNKDGTPFNDVVLFDPAVINDNGTIRLYFGTCFPFDNYPFMKPILNRVEAKIFNRTIGEVKKGIKGAFTCTLSDDMLSVTSKPVRLFPTRTKNTQWEEHPFFEASSIRKIENTYYFIYSSQKNHELCYATSRYPDHDFEFRGVIVSNGDVGYEGRKEKDRVNHTGTNHGSIEKINNRWYVFYHRQTNISDFSRQACAEPIDIKPNGSIPQVEITSSGLNSSALKPEGVFPAVICCNLTNGHMPHGANRKFNKIPSVTSKNGEQFIHLTKNTKVVYKYFNFEGEYGLTIKAKGKGTISVLSNSIDVESNTWKNYSTTITGNGRTALCFEMKKGSIDMHSFEFYRRNYNE